jgi:hypothetical protein
MGTYVRTQNIDHAIGETGSASLSVRSADVRVRGITGGEAHVRATFEIEAASDADADRIFQEVQMRVVKGSGDLIVDETDNPDPVGKLFTRIFRGHGDYELNLEAELPVQTRLRLSGVSSDVTVTDLHGEQRYNTVSGDLSVVNAGGSVRLETVSGDASVRADEPLELHAQTVSGDLNILTPTLRSLRANTVSGDVQLEAELDPTGDFRVETVSGDMSVGLVGSATFEIHGLSTDVSSDLDHRLEGQIDRRRLVIGNGVPRLAFNSMSGDVHIRHPRRISPRVAPAQPATELSPADREAQLDVLRALERGEIDVDEATRRLAGGS